MSKKYINRDWRNWNDNGKGVGAKKPTPKPFKIETFSSPHGEDWAQNYL